jgi:hypothetical protein
MKMRFAVLAWAVMALALAMPVLAQDPPATLTLSGTVTSSSPTSLTVRSEDGSTQTFMLDDRSTVPATLARGAVVNVTYETSGSQMRAVSVTANEAPPMPRTGTEATGTDPSRVDPNRRDMDPDRLPATASPLPLIALLSVVALASGLALRRHLA